jgi:hypothetical protein
MPQLLKRHSDIHFHKLLVLFCKLFVSSIASAKINSTEQIALSALNILKHADEWVDPDFHLECFACKYDMGNNESFMLSII